MIFKCNTGEWRINDLFDRYCFVCDRIILQLLLLLLLCACRLVQRMHIILLLFIKDKELITRNDEMSVSYI